MLYDTLSKSWPCKTHPENAASMRLNVGSPKDTQMCVAAIEFDLILNSRAENVDAIGESLWLSIASTSNLTDVTVKEPLHSEADSVKALTVSLKNVEVEG